MRSGPASWALGAGASVALHGAGAVVALALVAPEDMPEQPSPGARFELETTALERSRAEERAPEGEAAEGIAPTGAVAQGQGIVRREAPAAAPRATSAPPVAEPGSPTAAIAPEGAAARPASPDTPVTRPAAAPGTRAEARTPQAATAPSLASEPAIAPAQAVAGASAAATRPAAPRVAAQGIESGVVQAAFQPPERAASATSLPSAALSSEAPTGSVAAAAPIAGSLAPPEATGGIAAPSAVAEESVAPQSDVTGAPASSAPADGIAAASAPAEGDTAPSAPAGGTNAPSAPAEGETAPSAPAEGTEAPASNADGAPIATAAATGIAAAAAPAEGADALAAPAGGTQAVSAPAPSTQAPAAQAEGPVIGAALAWAGQGTLDPQGLAAVQAFLPEAARGTAGEEVRDGISALMASVPCARVHTAFNPETGALELRGHVPTAEARPELVGALQAQVGTSLPVQDALRLLPEPQCDVLTGIEGLGLPPSEEQFTDPALVGETGWAQDYAFSDGDRLTLDLEGPDYPAHIYLDYFDGAGNVVHIVPNQIVDLPALGPAEPFSVGRTDGLDLRISAPFGQDIVVALATDVPLYEGLRPTVEPAAEYLDFLRARLDEIGPVRGEWAYFFVTTTAR